MRLNYVFFERKCNKLRTVMFAFKYPERKSIFNRHCWREGGKFPNSREWSPWFLSELAKPRQKKVSTGISWTCEAPNLERSKEEQEPRTHWGVSVSEGRQVKKNVVMTSGLWKDLDFEDKEKWYQYLTRTQGTHGNSQTRAHRSTHSTPWAVRAGRQASLTATLPCFREWWVSQMFNPLLELTVILVWCDNFQEKHPCFLINLESENEGFGFFPFWRKQSKRRRSLSTRNPETHVSLGGRWHPHRPTSDRKERSAQQNCPEKPQLLIASDPAPSPASD